MLTAALFKRAAPKLPTKRYHIAAGRARLKMPIWVAHVPGSDWAGGVARNYRRRGKAPRRVSASQTRMFAPRDSLRFRRRLQRLRPGIALRSHCRFCAFPMLDRLPRQRDPPMPLINVDSVRVVSDGQEAFNASKPFLSSDARRACFCLFRVPPIGPRSRGAGRFCIRGRCGSRWDWWGLRR